MVRSEDFVDIVYFVDIVVIVDDDDFNKNDAVDIVDIYDVVDVKDVVYRACVRLLRQSSARVMLQYLVLVCMITKYSIVYLGILGNLGGFTFILGRWQK